MSMRFIEPLMPTLVEKPPEGEGWIHEVKFDGYRFDDGCVLTHLYDLRHVIA